MRALNLDYRRRNAWPKRLGWSALLLACTALAAQGWQYHQLTQGIEANQAELAYFTRQLQPAGHADPRAEKQLDEEMRHARSVLMQLDVPWNDLFEAVEASTNGEVALLGIEPEPRQETVRIIGEAKNYAAVLSYTRRLEETAPLNGVHLQNHRVETRDRERPVRFVLGAAWRRQP